MLVLQWLLQAVASRRATLKCEGCQKGSFVAPDCISLLLWVWLFLWDQMFSMSVHGDTAAVKSTFERVVRPAIKYNTPFRD